MVWKKAKGETVGNARTRVRILDHLLVLALTIVLEAVRCGGV